MNIKLVNLEQAHSLEGLASTSGNHCVVRAYLPSTTYRVRNVGVWRGAQTMESQVR